MNTSTLCVRPDRYDQFGSFSPPIYQTATFHQDSAVKFGEYDYSRSGNPTRTQLEKKLAQLEHGRFACAFASGMAAITSISRLLETGDNIVASNDLYGGSVRLLEQILPRQGISVTYADPTNENDVRDAISERTKLLLIETPTNPFLKVADIRAIANIAKESGAVLAVDNTMLSPCLQNPLNLGADLVVHSATKFLCGHSDVTAGAVVTNDEELHRKIRFVQNAEGAALSPFDSWLLYRGLKTLALRVERQSASALQVANFLKGVEGLSEIYYPGLADHPGRDVHSLQATGGGAVISFTTGEVEVSKAIVELSEICSIAVSFGSVNSTISLPCFMSHASIPEERSDIAPPQDLIRLSVGIEDVADILADLGQAVARGLARRPRAKRA